MDRGWLQVIRPGRCPDSPSITSLSHVGSCFPKRQHSCCVLSHTNVHTCPSTYLQICKAAQPGHTHSPLHTCTLTWTQRGVGGHELSVSPPTCQASTIPCHQLTANCHPLQHCPRVFSGQEALQAGRAGWKSAPSMMDGHWKVHTQLPRPLAGITEEYSTLFPPRAWWE